MNEYLRLKKSNCKNCYKCIRQCPVKSIKFQNNQAHIIEDECILCGQCFVVCPQNAKEIRNDTGAVRELIASGRPVYASVAPSFVANYPGATIAGMEKALRALGFAGASETAVGATTVKTVYDEMCERGDDDVIISSCCHTVNLLIRKYFPQAIGCLAPVLSPMQAHCKSLKALHPDAAAVFIGPCISKKDEAAQYPGVVVFALTSEELTAWMDGEGVTVEAAPDAEAGGKARLFPTTGGILRSMERRAADYTYITVDGIDNCVRALREICEGGLKKCFIEMSACVGSCVGGPAMDKHGSAVRGTAAVDRYAPDGDFAVDKPDADALAKPHSYIGVRRTMPGSKAIEEILHQMGKHKPEDELNCGSCGYNTCRDKAVAVLNGKAEISMCLPYLKEKAENFSDKIIKNTPNGIIVLNEALEVQQLNAAACEMLNLSGAQDILGGQVVRVLDPQPFLEVMETGRSIRGKRVYLAEYKRYVEQTVIYDKAYHIIMAIMRDITEEEHSRERKESMSRSTIEITDKVIEKQMRAVQEIASLLGETTAETKIALTKLKESLTDE